MLQSGQRPGSRGSFRFQDVVGLPFLVEERLRGGVAAH